MSKDQIYVQKVRDYQTVFGSDKGKRILWDLMRTCGFASDGFDKDPYQMAYNSGAKSMITRILNVLEMEESSLNEMIKENRKADENERKHFNV